MIESVSERVIKFDKDGVFYGTVFVKGSIVNFEKCEVSKGLEIEIKKESPKIINISNCSFKQNCSIGSGMNSVRFSDNALKVLNSQETVFDFNKIVIKGKNRSFQIDDSEVIFKGSEEFKIESDSIGIRSHPFSSTTFEINSPFQLSLQNNGIELFGKTLIRTDKNKLNFWSESSKSEIHFKEQLIGRSFSASSITQKPFRGIVPKL